MSSITPGSGCPNPNFCYGQGCLGKCQMTAYDPMLIAVAQVAPEVAKHIWNEAIEAVAMLAIYNDIGAEQIRKLKK